MVLLVKGTIVAYNQRLEKITQWSGKEAYLTTAPPLGACLCIRKGKITHYFQVQQEFLALHDNFLADGKLTIELRHQKQPIQLQLHTDESVAQLRAIHDIVSNERWDRVGELIWRKGARGKLELVDKYRSMYEDAEDGGDDDGSEGGAPTRQPAAKSKSAAVLEAEYVRATTTLNPEQQRVLRHIRDGRNVFFTGCAGTGKTFLIKEIVRMCDPATTFVTASTGIAAVEVGGVTLHSFAGIGMGSGTVENWLDKIGKSDRALQTWRKCRLLVIDEISMLDGELFDKLDRLAQLVRGKAGQPWGGIQLVLSGDFLQLPPVHSGAPPTFAFQSRCWQSLQLAEIHLTEVFRQSDQRFLDVLNAVRLGRVSAAAGALLKQCLTRTLDTSDSILPTKLRALNRDVEEENLRQLDALTGEKRVFTARDEGQEQYVKLLKQNSMLPERLELKPGAQVMLVRSVKGTRLTNGSRGVVVGFTDGLPTVRFTDGTQITVDRETQSIEVNRTVVAARTQLPLRLAWAMTIHKCQGMEIDRLEVSLDSSVFEYGQAYTALSRARTLGGLRLTKLDLRSIRAHPEVVKFYDRLSQGEAVHVHEEPPAEAAPAAAELEADDEHVSQDLADVGTFQPTVVLPEEVEEAEDAGAEESSDESPEDVHSASASPEPPATSSGASQDTPVLPAHPPPRPRLPIALTAEEDDAESPRAQPPAGAAKRRRLLLVDSDED